MIEVRIDDSQGIVRGARMRNAPTAAHRTQLDMLNSDSNIIPESVGIFRDDGSKSVRGLLAHSRRTLSCGSAQSSGHLQRRDFQMFL